MPIAGVSQGYFVAREENFMGIAIFVTSTSEKQNDWVDRKYRYNLLHNFL